MNRHCYETVPQRDDLATPQPPHNPIILSPIPSSATHTYNYNSGVPTSSASSIIASSSSIPNSPPPSFHTHSSPGTPRPTPSYLQASSTELWGVAPSTIGTETTTSNDALATIAGLKQRVEWLEESIGRLILEKESRGNGEGDDFVDSARGHRDNCCVSFIDTSPDLERAIRGSRSNCCVSFRRHREGGSGKCGRDRERKKAFFALLVGGVLMLTILWLVLGGRGEVVVTSSHGNYGQ